MTSATDRPKRKGPLFWVLTAGVACLLLFAGLLLFAYIYGRQLRNSGDPVLANMHLMVGPENEILEENPELHIIHYRNKKTGAESLMTLDPATNQIKIVPYKIEQPEKAPSK